MDLDEVPLENGAAAGVLPTETVHQLDPRHSVDDPPRLKTRCDGPTSHNRAQTPCPGLMSVRILTYRHPLYWAAVLCRCSVPSY